MKTLEIHVPNFPKHFWRGRYFRKYRYQFGTSKGWLYPSGKKVFPPRPPKFNVEGAVRAQRPAGAMASCGNPTLKTRGAGRAHHRTRMTRFEKSATSQTRHSKGIHTFCVLQYFLHRPLLSFVPQAIDCTWPLLYDYEVCQLPKTLLKTLLQSFLYSRLQ